MSEHARLSLSHTDTWLTCAAWPRMVEGMGDEESPEIEFGNVSHEILEEMLMGKDHDHTVNREETECAQVAYNYVQKRWVEMGADETNCLAEGEVKIPEHGDLCGTSDVILYNDLELEIIDLKTGAGTYVDEKTSGQLKSYAQAAIDTYGIFPETIRLTIVQPRYWGSEDPIRSVSVTLGDLAAWKANILLPAAARTDDPNAPGTASVRCKRCAGRHVCAYRDDAVAEALTGESSIPEALQTAMGVTEVAIRNNQDMVIYNNDRLSEVLMLVPVIRDYCDALEEHAKEIIIKGEQVPSFKVVSVPGRKKWINEGDVTKALHGTRINKDSHKQALKTPLQVLALVPKTNKALTKKLEGLIGSGSDGLKLVLESDKGESIAPAFKVLEQAAPAAEVPAALPSFLL